MTVRKMKQDPTDQKYQVGKRWRLADNVFDELGNKVADKLRLVVLSPAGTLPRAYGSVLVDKDALQLPADARRVLGWAIRSARCGAAHFRETNKPR